MPGRIHQIVGGAQGMEHIGQVQTRQRQVDEEGADGNADQQLQIAFQGSPAVGRMVIIAASIP